jgi:hypothetical protein
LVLPSAHPSLLPLFPECVEEAFRELRHYPILGSWVNKEPDKRKRRSELWSGTEVGEKRLWHWLQLLSALAIPVVLTVAGSWFTLQ